MMLYHEVPPIFSPDRTHVQHDFKCHSARYWSDCSDHWTVEPMGKRLVQSEGDELRPWTIEDGMRSSWLSETSLLTIIIHLLVTVVSSMDQLLPSVRLLIARTFAVLMITFLSSHLWNKRQPIPRVPHHSLKNCSWILSGSHGGCSSLLPLQEKIDPVVTVASNATLFAPYERWPQRCLVQRWHSGWPSLDWSLLQQWVLSLKRCLLRCVSRQQYDSGYSALNKHKW